MARIVIVYVLGTTEDPQNGAHETFIDLIEDVATEKKNFGVKDSTEICKFLNDWKTV